MDRDDGRCPVCGGETTFGYGFAGGGLGPYTFCLDCDALIDKMRTGSGDCWNGMLEREESKT